MRRAPEAGGDAAARVARREQRLAPRVAARELGAVRERRADGAQAHAQQVPAWGRASRVGRSEGAGGALACRLRPLPRPTLQQPRYESRF